MVKTINATFIRKCIRFNNLCIQFFSSQYFINKIIFSVMRERNERIHRDALWWTFRLPSASFISMHTFHLTRKLPAKWWRQGERKSERKFSSFEHTAQKINQANIIYSKYFTSFVKTCTVQWWWYNAQFESIKLSVVHTFVWFAFSFFHPELYTYNYYQLD